MWTEGTIRVGASVFHYWVKHYEEPSIYGYEEGRASKSPCGGMAKRCSISTGAWIFRRKMRKPKLHWRSC